MRDSGPCWGLVAENARFFHENFEFRPFLLLKKRPFFARFLIKLSPFEEMATLVIGAICCLKLQTIILTLQIVGCLLFRRIIMALIRKLISEIFSVNCQLSFMFIHWEGIILNVAVCVKEKSPYLFYNDCPYLPHFCSI